MTLVNWCLSLHLEYSPEPLLWQTATCLSKLSSNLIFPKPWPHWLMISSVVHSPVTQTVIVTLYLIYCLFSALVLHCRTVHIPDVAPGTSKCLVRSVLMYPGRVDLEKPEWNILPLLVTLVWILEYMGWICFNLLSALLPLFYVIIFSSM